VIAGYGRIGKHISMVLKRLNLDFIVIEFNYNKVLEAKSDNMPVIFGNVSQRVVLEAAEIDNACLLIITLPSILVTQSVVNIVTELKPDLHIVARAEEIEHIKTLYDLGVYEVVQPHFEAGLEITRQALLHLNIPANEIIKYEDSVRHDLYAPLYRHHGEYKEISDLSKAKNLLDLNWVRIDPASPVIGKSIKELDIRKKTGVSIISILNDKDVKINPDSDYRFNSGDRLAIMGNKVQILKFQELIDYTN